MDTTIFVTVREFLDNFGVLELGDTIYIDYHNFNRFDDIGYYDPFASYRKEIGENQMIVTDFKGSTFPYDMDYIFVKVPAIIQPIYKIYK